MIVLFVGCKKNDTNPSETNPKVIPVQTIVHASVPLAGTSNLAILAGSSITNTGATVITGDMGLSPGTSIGGFPPGILNGKQHINDSLSPKAKLDLTHRI